MNPNFFESFKECFSEYDDCRDFKCGEDRSWIFAIADKNAAADIKEGFHYELIERGRGEVYVELHFELYKYQWFEMREALIKVLNKEESRREVIATSYYSSLIWRVRRPVFDAKHIKEAVGFLRNVVNAAKKVVDSKNNSEISDEVGKVDEQVPLMIPGVCSIATIAQMLIEGSKEETKQDKTCNRLVIPSVQRGKVWNAARIETLWDSIFRNIPIGALSIRNRVEDSFAYDLLDGQQRATAIALGYDSFPGSSQDDSRKYESILWIDLKKKEDGRYGFFVTTASQPWGYADSANETKNSLLRYADIKEATKGIRLEDNQIKPYPYQLYPIKAKLPVPYTLLRQYAENAFKEKKEYSLSAFKRYIELLQLQWRGWIEFLSNEYSELDDFSMLCEAILKKSNEYSVFLLDANSVSDEDVALYFTRIGKGGVVPSDEELAYSVLKSKLGSDFRRGIQRIYEEYGLANESRIAHLAIRLFKSESDKKKYSRPHFFSGSVFSAVMDMCKNENAAVKQEFLRFIKDDFVKRIKKVEVEKSYKLTQWHSARYASERNGDVFLLLLLAAGDDQLFVGYNVTGLAELLFCYASHIDYSVRRIFEEGLPIALANLSKETYYGKPRLSLPISPEVLERVIEEWKEKEFSIASLLNLKNYNPEVAQIISEGYNNSSYDRAYNILLYACKESQKNKNFNYDKSLGLWLEDNCPWDYDHIMPHSTIEKMENSDEKTVCEWLKNSIGNLAPLPFSLNRSWSDAPRNENYPCNDNREQEVLYINGQEVKSMWDTGRISPLNFCKMVISRYKKMYSFWYNKLELNGILNFESAFKDKSGIPKIWELAKHRYSIFRQVKEELQSNGWTFKRIVTDNEEDEIPECEMHKEFCCNQVITLSKEVNGVLSVALSKCGVDGMWEIGLRKSCKKNSTVKETFKLVQELNFNDLEKVKLQEGSEWWYLYDSKKDIALEEINEIVKTLRSLYEKVENLRLE